MIWPWKKSKKKQSLHLYNILSDLFEFCYLNKIQIEKVRIPKRLLDTILVQQPIKSRMTSGHTSQIMTSLGFIIDIEESEDEFRFFYANEICDICKGTGMNSKRGQTNDK